MERELVSSRATLFFKWALPMLWIIGFGTITLFIVMNAHLVNMMSPNSARITVISFLLTNTALLYLTVVPLKRVEFGTSHFYVTNYVKLFKYTYQSIERLQENNYGLFRTVTIYFHQPSYFGKRIVFLEGRRFKKFLAEHPHITAAIFEADKSEESMQEKQE